MMTPNHALAGLTLALTVLRWRPELAGIAAIAGFVGGALPDLDSRLGQHRKTLHYPAYYTVLAGACLAAALALDPVGAAVASASTAAVVGAYFFGAAALHCYADYFVAIQQPDDEVNADGVLYLHPRDRWIGPVKIIPYAGSPGDLLVGFALAVPPLLIYDGVAFGLTVLSLAGSVLYFAKRRYERRSRERSTDESGV